MGLFGSPNGLAAVREKTRRDQAAAADPTASAWVSANAGTGKTHVLTMRVLRLLLDGVEPERILALTYTKAAAAEMSTRVFDRLAGWVTAGDAELKAALADLLDHAPSSDVMVHARRLFARAIETPGGLKVQTIHAFCERLLQRFPLEAGVPPGFEILDDQQRAALLAEAVDETLTEATSAKPGAPLARALKSAVGFAAEGNFDALLADALRQHAWIDAAVRLDLDDEERLVEAENIYRQALGLGPASNLEATTAAFANVLPKSELMRVRDVLASGSNGDIKASEKLAAALAAAGTAGQIAVLCEVFLTGTGDPRKSLITRKLAATHPDVEALLLRTQQRVVDLHEERCKLQLLDATLALVRLGDAVMQRYGTAKARRAALDFDDLVGKAASLLRSSGAVEWVLYKLDGGLDHILVDEAQDTSPVQWHVIRALAEEFFSGHGTTDKPRTLFAVGDEKQSIYSFQGAAPAMFAAAGNEFEQRAGRAGMRWRRVPLTLSFRSVEPLLAAVDRIFAKPERTPGLTASREPISHVANRAGHAGLVEIWPLEPYRAATPAEPWSPLAETGASPSVVRLAARIAGTIRAWLDSREMLPSLGRPIRPGDILILVRKRAPFAPVIISALKARDIGVAGADRLMLADQIAVQDLIALGDFLNLPDDDLALASMLKSPLFNLDDDDLMALAQGRKGSLWEELRSRAPQNGRFESVAETLQRWRMRSERLPPFEFYSSILDGEGGRGRMLARLGPEAADAIDEFLNLGLAYDDSAPPSLQGFLAALREGQREVKRDMEQGRNEVRVMTVHGAKGLEAPIVFLPDTCTTRSARPANGLLVLDDAERPSTVPPPFLWPVKGTSKVGAVQQAKARIADAETEERNRLLYVALTRARDRLYVAGFEGLRAPPANCWYNLIKSGLEGHLKEITGPDGRSVWQVASSQTTKPEPAKSRADASVASTPLPAWAKTKAPREPRLTMPLVPSRLAPLEMEAEDAAPAAPARRRPPAEPPILPPVLLADDGRFLRGTLTHALLEHLPGVAKESWRAAAEAFLASRAAQLSVPVRKDIAAETLAVLEDPDLAPLFGPRSRAEVAIAAEVAHPGRSGAMMRLTGKIDRLVHNGDDVMIVDYKTNRPPPADPAHVADAYLLQLAAYRLGVGRIFPGVPVRAAILWTDGPRIMEIAPGVLDSYQQRLWELDPSSLDA
jgi:ATP-dependent helicase/nuclease subunit A